MKIITEGTKSWLFGCHSFIHSILIIRAWKHLYKSYPSFKECICIMLHDIGYCGKNYLTDKSNSSHAELGAQICGELFGGDYYLFVLGHSVTAAKKHGIAVSKLEAPDDYSWILAPDWWLRLNQLVEPQLHGIEWKKKVKENWDKNGLLGRGASFELTKAMLLEKENSNG